MTGITTTVVGNLTADPELRFTASGRPVVSCTIAVNERRRKADGTGYEDGPTSFMRVNAWQQLAEHVAETLSKGDRVIVSGQLREREWVTDAGEKRRSWELTADEVGVALSYATAKIARAARRSDSPPPPEDPWAGNGAQGQPAEVPF